MWNPEVFPGNPEQWTRALAITMWSDGTATAQPYGTKDGMNIAMETYESGNRTYVRFPFTIDGF